jgi:hypothetical protein
MLIRRRLFRTLVHRQIKYRAYESYHVFGSGAFHRNTPPHDIIVCPRQNETLREKHATMFHEIMHLADMISGHYIPEEVIQDVSEVMFDILVDSGLYKMEPSEADQLELSFEEMRNA